MTTTAAGFGELLDRVNDATKLLQHSETVPDEVAGLIDGLESSLGAAVPLRFDADPYLMTALWAAAFRAEKALRHDNAADRRRDVRVALEQLRHALRDITEAQPYNDHAPVRDVLAHTADTLAAGQKTLADLLGVSVRQVQRWLADDGPEPAADDAARIRVIGQLVDQLRHALTGPGTVAWFYRTHPVLGRRPIELLDDPLAYPRLRGAAQAVRAQTA
jgi:hypothetical protein